jgi:hypothetical protein
MERMLNELCEFGTAFATTRWWGAKTMPVNVVRTREEEILWERAKARAREQYPEATGERFYRIVMAIYKKMAHYGPHTSARADRASAARRI